ncbi:Hamartin protein-domain-containing protein [Dissophora ornata]|nr:Hamartin protein-domain-containing protein [Dissophora ornata]
MSGSAPTVKDVYKAVTTDFHAFLATDKPREHDSPRETIQQYLDRFVKSNSNATTGHHGGHHVSASTMPSSAGAHHFSTSALGSGGLGVSGAAPSTYTNAPTSSVTILGAGNSTAALQRHANELWYRSLTNNATFQHPSNLPFAFHKVSQVASSSGSPSSSAPTSQNVSTTGSPTIGGGGTGGAHSATSGQATPIAGTNPNLSTSPTMQPTSTTFNISNTSANVSLVAQKTSAHLIILYTQHGMGNVPIASVASRMIVYLTHLLPFLTPRLIITDWWDRLIEPSLQGEIKLGKDALKACRDLVTECMNRDHLLDSHGSGTGSMLIAGDEEGQLDTAQAMAAMPIAQFVLRKHIRAAHRLNHRLLETVVVGNELHVDGLNDTWLRAKALSTPTGHAGHGPGSSGAGFTTSYSSLPSSTQRSEYPAMLQDMETQLRLLTKARAIIRRKQDILVKNLESILFAYGGGIGRVKDFFSCLYTYFVGARYRPEILGLLCQFIRRQRVHLHQILATPLFDSLLLSLKYDTSPLIVSLGLMTLIMLMPRIPAALNDRLPDLFLILSRILCWPRSRHQVMAVTDQEGANLTGQTIKSFDEFEGEGVRTNTSSDSTHNNKSTESGQPSTDIEFEDVPLYSHGIRWRRYGPAKPGGTSEGAPDPTAIFSSLYGLFPCNLLKFLHSPRAYMKQVLTPAGSPKQSSGSQVGEDDSAGNTTDGGVMSPKDSTGIALYIDEDLLKSRVQTLLKRHSLHPDLLTLTPEQEVVNKARWQKLEPMEIVAMCVGLDVWSAGGNFGAGPILKSIEEDHRSTSRQDSDEEEEDMQTVALSPSSLPFLDKPVQSSSMTTTDISEQSTPSEAHVSVESFQSEESQGTPIEILTQEDFFGPRAVKENSTRLPPSSSASSFQRDRGGHGTGAAPLPRARARSKEGPT